MPLGAEYRSNLSVSLLQLSEKGELYNLKRRWWTPEEEIVCQIDVKADGDELSIIELSGVFVVLGAGVVVSFIIGLCEFLWNLRTVAVEEKVAV